MATAAVWLSAALLSAAATGIALADDTLPPPGAAAPPAAADKLAQPTPPAVRQTPAAAIPAAAPAPQAQAAPAPFPAQPPPTTKPGFIYQFGRWWDNTRAHFGELPQPPSAAQGAAQATQDAVNNAAQATRNAVDALIRLPSSRFIEIHRRCAVAPNGAPDCRSAAANACRVKGFSGGHPVDVQSSENCPPAVWMSGRQPAAGQCPQETVVLLAACD